MSQETIGLLISKGIFGQTDYDHLKLILKNEKDVQDLIKKILGQESGKDIWSKKDCLKKMCDQPYIRQHMIPYLHYQMIKIFVAQIFGAEIDNEEYMEFIQQQVKNYSTDVDQMFKKIYEGLLGGQIPEEDLKQCVLQLKNEAEILLNDLKGYKMEITNKSMKKEGEQEEEATCINPQQFYRQADIKNAQQYLGWLQEDIYQMPKTIIDYKLREIQIEMIQKFIKDKKEPQLSQTSKLYIKQIEISHPEGKKAKEKLLESNEDIRRNLSILRECACGIDVHDLFRMINKGRQLQQEQQNNLNKKNVQVLLFLGLSKGGKTTILTRLMGYEMEKKKIEGIYTIQPKNPEKMKKQHKDLIIGHLPKSTTRYPRLFRIPQQFMKQEFKKKSDDEDDDEDDGDYVTYGMDCAGFQDTAGIQVEISNRITTIQALKKVKRLQIVIVINKNHWGATGKDLEKLAKTTSSIIKNLKKAKKSITFVFNQFDKDFKETLHANVLALQSAIMQRKGDNVADSNYKQFFKILKEQTKNEKNIYTVDPLKMDPKIFLKSVSLEKKMIEDAYLCLSSDIGTRGKQQIKKYCERYHRELKKHYNQGDILGTKYFLKMLKKIESEPRLQSDLQVIEIQDQLKLQLEKKIESLRIQLQQLSETVIKDKQKRKKKIEGLHQLTQSLKKEINQFKQIQNSSTLQKNLSDVINDVLRFYKQKINLWDPQKLVKIQEIIETTVLAVQIFQKFATNKLKEEFNQSLEAKTKEFTIKMKNQFNQLKKQHKIKNNLKCFMLLQESRGKQFSIPLVKQIQAEYQGYKKMITMIPLKIIEVGEDIDLVLTSDQVQQITNIQNFLKFTQIVLTYPKEMIKGIQNQMKTVTQLIVVTVPTKIMEQLKKLKKQNSQEEEVDEEEIKDSGEKIKKIKTYIQSLKILDQISYVQKQHKGKIIEQFEGFEHIIEIQIKKFQKIRDAFDKNNVTGIKKDVNKIKSQFKHLQNMVKITQNLELINNFKSLKDNFADSLGSFVVQNDIYETLSFKNTQYLKKIFQKYKKIKQFGEIHKIFDNSKQLKEKIKKVLQKIENAVKEPLTTQISQIKTREYFQIKKLSQFLGYVDTLIKVGRNYFQSAFIAQIDRLDKQTRQQVNNIFQNKMESLKQLKQIMDSSKTIEEQQNQKIHSFLTNKNVLRCRKSLALLFQITQNQAVDVLFNDVDYLWKIINESFENYGRVLKEQIQIKKKPINVLQKLSQIASKLKNIQISTQQEPIFIKINEYIREQMKKLAQSDSEKKQRLMASQEGLQGQSFREVYEKILQDKTQSGAKNRIELQNYFKKYRKNCQMKLEELKMEDEGDFHKKLLQMMIILQKYHENYQIITEKLETDNNFKDFSKLKDQQSILSFVGNKICEYFQQAKNEMKFMKNNHSKTYESNMKKIQTEIQRLKVYDCKIDVVQNLKQSSNGKFLYQLLKDQKKSKEELIKIFKKDKGVLETVDSYFLKFYESLDQKQQEQIIMNIINVAKDRIKSLKSVYDSNFDEYQKQLEFFERVCLRLPQQGSSKINQQVEKMKQKIKLDTQAQCKQIEKQQLFSMESIISLSQKYKKSKNTDKLQELSILASDKIKKLPKKNYLNILEKDFWPNKQKFQQLQNLQQVVIKQEKKIIEKINITREEKQEQFLRDYKNNRQSYIESETFSEISLGSSEKYIGPIKILIEIYSTFKKGLIQNLIISQQSKCQKIIADIEKFIGEIKKQFQETVNNFKKITQNPMQHQNQIGQTFYHIQLYARDFPNIISHKNQQFKNLIKDMGFNQLLKAITNTKNQLILRVDQILQKKFVLYSDSIKNNSDQQNKDMINEFQQQLAWIKVLEIPYNSYINSQKPIRISQIQKQIQSQIKEAIEKYETDFRSFVQKGSETINPRLNFIPKIINCITSAPRSFLICSTEQKNVVQSTPKIVLQQQKKKTQETITKLEEQYLSQKKTKRNFKEKAQEKLDKQIQRIKNQAKIKIRSKQQQHKKNIQSIGMMDSGKKGKIQIQFNSQKQLINNQSQKQIQKQKDKYNKDKRLFQKSLKGELDDKIKIFADEFIKMKKLDFIASIKTQVNLYIDQKLKNISRNKDLLASIFNLLQGQENSNASKILNEHQAFNQLNGRKFTIQTSQTNKIDYILKQMRLKADQSSAFQVHYTDFMEEQNKYFQQYKSGNTQIVNKLKEQIVTIGQQFKKLNHEKRSSISNKKRILLLSKIFALWSISASSPLENDQSDDEEQQYIIYYRAHAAQIICIMIILCLDQQLGNEVINLNRLAQVKTGQGKSIVIAVLSIYFALFGYEVHCACYSPMLSKRDESQFFKLFHDCKVQSQIHYGIFENIIKRILNQKQQGSEKQQIFENVIQQIVTTKSLIAWYKKWWQKIKNFSLFSKNTESKKILIVDQFDVLVDKNYYGDTFNQSIDLHDNSVVELFQFIWKNRAIITPSKIQSSNQFKQVVKKYQPLQKVLKNQIHGMVAALKTYKDQNYTIVDKKIMYKVEDSLMDASYSYNTVYAYLEEYQKGNISRYAYQSHLTINLCVAEFSYALLPKYYSHVVGVTGTLTCLPKYIKYHLEKNYNILPKQMFSIPSVYGKKGKRQTLKSICIQKQKHIQEIIKSITQFFSKQLPILVFFRNKNELLEFFNAEKFKQYQKYTYYVTEQHSQQERNDRINNSSLQNTITLLTSSFIRGTDFKLLNKKAIKLGGFHGIVAYLIDSPADYIQATGRVARQGKPGTFIEIFQKEQLQILSLDKNDDSALGKIQDQRYKKQQKEEQSCQQKLKVSGKRHQQTIKVFADKQFDQEKLIQYIASKNKFPQIFQAKKAKVLLLVDATISMTSLFAQLKQFLPQIFDDVYETLDQKKLPGCLQMQILLYRNYNSPVNQLLEISTSENKGENLKRFINQAKVNGGWGNQAVEVALQYVNTLKEVDEIILIGDARGNTPEQVKTKRDQYKKFEPQRIQKGYLPTNTQKQMDQLIRKKIQISGFYLNPVEKVRQYFEGLSRSTNGVSQSINIYSKEASSTMTQFIVERSLKLIGGGSNQGDALIAEYKKILSKRLAR